MLCPDLTRDLSKGLRGLGAREGVLVVDHEEGHTRHADLLCALLVSPDGVKVAVRFQGFTGISLVRPASVAIRTNSSVRPR